MKVYHCDDCNVDVTGRENFSYHNRTSEHHSNRKAMLQQRDAQREHERELTSASQTWNYAHRPYVSQAFGTVEELTTRGLTSDVAYALYTLNRELNMTLENVVSAATSITRRLNEDLLKAVALRGVDGVYGSVTTHSSFADLPVMIGKLEARKSIAESLSQLHGVRMSALEGPFAHYVHSELSNYSVEQAQFGQGFKLGVRGVVDNDTTFETRENAIFAAVSRVRAAATIITEADAALIKAAR